jgi:uncharacterized membrane-anchored protein
MDSLHENEIGSVGLPFGLERLLGFLNSHLQIIIIVAIAFQIIVLLATIVQRSAPLVHGKTVLLRVVPVDPRDLFRGDFVTLSYSFSRVTSSSIPGLPQNYYSYTYGRDRQEMPVYVVLEPEDDGTHWQAKSFSIDRPESGTFLRGTLYPSGGVVCGIESYYVQEGKGRDYEEAIRNHKLSAEVAIGSDGGATLKKLIIE